jgi:ABC-type phosphate/phosphonate transport system permease subunit
MFDVRELKENHPEFALLLETSGEESVQFSNLSYTKVPVHDLEVGSHILVRAGEVCYILYKILVLAFCIQFIASLCIFLLCFLLSTTV